MSHGVWKGVYPWFLSASVNFRSKHSFYEKRLRRRRKKIKIFLVATNIIANRPLERRLTGMSTARAKRTKEGDMKMKKLMMKEDMMT